jgi:tetratricopeptide (TPR) repeat protein
MCQKLMTHPETLPGKKLLKPAVWISLFLLLSTLAVYWPVTKYEFVAYDDTDFVTANPHVQAGLTVEGFKWAWHSEVARNWHPLTMLTHMLDCQFFGLNAGRHHLTNLLLHAANSLLLFYVLKRMTRALWRSAAVAALFALHPLHVESVAWIAERKDVLSTLFALLTLWAYASYTEAAKAPAARPARRLFYGLTLVFFALGLMSKPMLVTLPFVLLLLDFWPLERWSLARLKPSALKAKAGKPVALAQPAASRSLRWLALEKAPFLALSAVVSWITFAVQKHGGAMLSVSNWPIGSRMQNALVSYVRYIGKMFWPRKLAALYLRTGDWPAWQVVCATLALLAITALVAAQGRRRPYLAIGWFWYLGTLIPVIGVVQVGMQTIADRYTYLPLVGLFIILAWGACDLALRWQLPRFIPAGLAAAALAACMALTARQITYWKNSETLFQRMIAATQNNYMAHYNLGNYYSRHNRAEDAIANFREALREEPNYADAHNNLGGVLLEEKKYDEAISHYTDALALCLDYTQYFNLANAQADAASARGDSVLFAQAVQNYQQALKLKPDATDVFNNLGMTLAAAGKTDEAIAQFRAALQLKPDLEAARYNLAFSLASAHRAEESIAQYCQAARLEPTTAQAHHKFATDLLSHGKTDEAVLEFRAALRIKPDFETAQFDLADVLSRAGKLDDAIACYAAAVRLNPNHAESYNGLGVCYAMQGKMDQAAQQFKEVIRLKPDDAGAYGNLGNALAAGNKLDEAMTFYLQALKRNPNDFQTEFNMGLSLARQGKKTEAASHYRAALRINPNYAQAQRALAELAR